MVIWRWLLLTCGYSLIFRMELNYGFLGARSSDQAHKVPTPGLGLGQLPLLTTGNICWALQGSGLGTEIGIIVLV